MKVVFAISNDRGVYLFRLFTGDTGQDFAQVSGTGEFRAADPPNPRWRPVAIR